MARPGIQMAEGPPALVGKPRDCRLDFRIALGVLTGSLLALATLDPSGNLARGNQPSWQEGIERAREHDQSLIELLAREIPRLSFALECARLAGTSPLRQGPTLVHLERDV